MDQKEIERVLFAAEDLSRRAHAGQFRRDGITPYFEHPRAVAGRVKEPEEKIVAFLHDVLEDTDYTVQDLIDGGIPEHLVAVVQLLTKTPDVKYDDYISKIRDNKIATNVKIADMLSNLSDTPSKEQIRKYAKALLYLTE